MEGRVASKDFSYCSEKRVSNNWTVKRQERWEMKGEICFMLLRLCH